MIEWYWLIPAIIVGAVVAVAFIVVGLSQVGPKF